jgi:hypothetical protein
MSDLHDVVSEGIPLILMDHIKENCRIIRLHSNNWAERDACSLIEADDLRSDRNYSKGYNLGSAAIFETATTATFR